MQDRPGACRKQPGSGELSRPATHDTELSSQTAPSCLSCLHAQRLRVSHNFGSSSTDVLCGDWCLKRFLPLPVGWRTWQHSPHHLTSFCSFITWAHKQLSWSKWGDRAKMGHYDHSCWGVVWEALKPPLAATNRHMDPQPFLMRRTLEEQQQHYCYSLPLGLAACYFTTAEAFLSTTSHYILNAGPQHEGKPAASVQQQAPRQVHTSPPTLPHHLVPAAEPPCDSRQEAKVCRELQSALHVQHPDST